MSIVCILGNTDLMNYELTKHAQRVLEEREIPLEWLERALVAPDLTMPDPNDSLLERCFRCIPEYDNRILRVVVNKSVVPHRIVSVFFDRTMKGRL